MFNKVNFSKEFFREFQKDPKGTFEKYGIEWKPSDENFFKQDFSRFSFEEFKKRLEKSRFFEFFIF